MKTPKTRLDNALAPRGLAASRNKARAMIMAGEILVNGETETRADRTVKDEDAITLKEKKYPYVSRGGVKLKSALDNFNIHLKGKICADIGVATGGFSHCMLLEGAKEVFGVDVGRGQIAAEILAFPNFRFIPNTNARFMTPGIFPVKIDFAAVDVSFISLKLVMEPLFKCLAQKSETVFLIKPQFELTPKETPRGIVKSQESRKKAIAMAKDFFENIAKLYNAQDAGLITSPICGVHGNIEYLWHIKLG
jgi:23S rRNA (cytidine1920-2'-O)/16S rRNA (cytidine1409-2'-O)-methyltransferase